MSAARVKAPTRPARAMWITVASPQTWGVGRILGILCVGRASLGHVNATLPARAAALTGREARGGEGWTFGPPDTCQAAL